MNDFTEIASIVSLVKRIIAGVERLDKQMSPTGDARAAFDAAKAALEKLADVIVSDF